MGSHKSTTEEPTHVAQGGDTETSPLSREDRIAVLLVDSQNLFRAGLARLLGDDERLLVMGSSPGHRELAETCAVMSIDVVVTDIELRETNGIELTRLITSTVPGTRVLLLAPKVDWRVIPAMAAGAAGFLLKDADPEAIRSAVVAVHLGEKVLCREAAEWLIDEPAVHRLTRRELDVLRMVAAGADNGEIADRLGLRHKTVRNYVSRLYRKLSSQSRTEIATYASELPPDPGRTADPVEEALPLAGASS